MTSTYTQKEIEEFTEIILKSDKEMLARVIMFLTIRGSQQTAMENIQLVKSILSE